MKHYLIILLLSILAIFIHGYQFAVSDQEIFIPYILKSQNPTLFPNDSLFNQSSAHASLFYPVIGFLTKFFDLQVVFFVGYLIFQFAFFFALHRLSKNLLKDNKLAYFSLLPFLLPKFIGGTAAMTFDLFFGYRSVGIVFLIFYLSFLVEKKFAKSFTIALVGLLFHPLSIIPVILALPALMIYDSGSKLKDLFRFLFLPSLAIMIIFLLFRNNFTKELFIIKDNVWLSVIKLRDNYLFISTWHLRAWEALALPFTLIILFINRLDKNIKRLIIILSLVSLSIFTANFFLLETFKIPSLAQFQLVRAIVPLAYIGLIISPRFLTTSNRLVKFLGTISFIFLCLNLFDLYAISVILFSISPVLSRGKFQKEISIKPALLIITAIIFLNLIINAKSPLDFKEEIQFPKNQNDWINLQLWAKQNTRENEAFLTPPWQTGFRIFSQRSIMGDIKDGAVVIYAKDYAIKWSKLMKDLQKYDSFTDEDFVALSKNYNFDYIVTSNRELKFNVVYKNNSYIIYRI